MFGFGKKKIPAGATEKIELAKKMRAEGRYNVNQKGGGGETRYPSQAVPIAIVYVFATLLSALLTSSGSSTPLSSMHFTGISSIDNVISGTDIVSFVGNEDEDRLFTILGRGLAFFILSGIVPLIAFVAENLFFKKTVMPLVICWSVIIILMIFYLFVPQNSIWPFLRDLPGNIRDLARAL